MSLVLSLGAFAPVMLALMGVLMVVLRAGASRVYFDVVGTFQADRMLKDAQAMSTTMNALMLDAFSGIEEAAMVLGEPFAQMVDDLLPVAKAVGEARIEFEKFVQEGEDLEAVTAAVVNIGEGFAFAADESLRAAARMAQLGGVLGPGMVGPGTEIGMKFGLISGMETEAAMQRMINLQQQTKFMTDALDENLNMEERAIQIRANSMYVLDQLNTVENRSAATMSQITYVMNQFAAQAHLTGESIAFMAAMSATLIEAGEEQGKGGRALKMIYARLGADTSGAATALQDLGVATHDAAGNLRPLSDIIRDLVVNMEDKTAAEKQNIAQLVAGNRHYVRLIKLMENYTRVEELALEALLTLSPAQEEVNRRLDENITSLRIAEAELFNYKAVLSDSLVPSLTAATERQTDFTIVLGELSTGILAPLVQGMAGFIKLVQNVAAPMMQATISLNQLNVASQTYRVLQRAIAGDELVREGFLGRYEDKMNVISMSQERLNAVMKGYRKELKKIREEQEVAEIVGVNLSNEEVANMQEKLALNAEWAIKNRETLAIQNAVRSGLAQENALIASLTDAEKKHLLQLELIEEHSITGKREQDKLGKATKMINALIDEGATLSGLLNEERNEEIAAVTESIRIIKAANMTRAEENALIQQLLASHFGQKRADEIQAEMEKEREIEEERKKSMKTMQARTALLNKFSLISMVAAGTLTIMGKETKSARMAMMLSTASMLPYIANMINSILVTQGDAAAKSLSALAADALGVANLHAAWTAGILSASMKAAWASLAKFAGVVAIFLAVTFALSILLEKLNIFNTAFARLDDTISQSVLLDADEIMRIFDMGLDASADGLKNASAELKILDDEIKSLEDAGKIVPSDLTAEQQKWAVIVGNHERANELLREKELLDKHSLDDLKQLTLYEQDRLDYAAKMQGMARGLQHDTSWYGTESYYEYLNQIQEEYGHILGENRDIWEEMQEVGLTTTAEIEGAVRTLGGLDARSATEGVISISDELENAKNALYEFNDAREELFFGFAAANVTGDLVKQVVNKGVETLITNTEVIMTNNFNGMTTDQVADEILLQIERRAGSLSGITITG